MAKMIQLRHVPEELHRKLKARAAIAGLTLSDYLLREVERIAARPTREELIQRIRESEPVRLKTPTANAVRAARDHRK